MSKSKNRKSTVSTPVSAELETRKAKLQADLAEVRKQEVKALAAQKEAREKSRQKLLALPTQNGFDNMQSFLTALRNAIRPESGRGRRVTPEVRTAVEAAVKAGTVGRIVAETYGVSIPYIQTIKKDLGLVKVRKTATA